MNTGIPSQAISTARGTLAQSDAMRGLSAMTPPNTGMYNSDDGGAMSKPYINAQPTENQALAMQELQQNGMTSAPQQVSAARGAITKQMTEQETAANRAQLGLATEMANLLEARGSGNKLMELNGMMQSNERERYINSIATSQAMANAQAPELGAYVAQTQQYSG